METKPNPPSHSGSLYWSAGSSELHVKPPWDSLCRRGGLRMQHRNKLTLPTSQSATALKCEAVDGFVTMFLIGFDARVSVSVHLCSLCLQRGCGDLAFVPNTSHTGCSVTCVITSLYDGWKHLNAFMPLVYYFCPRPQYCHGLTWETIHHPSTLQHWGGRNYIL